MVITFDLCNAPASSQRYINRTLRQHLDDFASAYILDDFPFLGKSLGDDFSDRNAAIWEVFRICALQLVGYIMDDILSYSNDL